MKQSSHSITASGFLNCSTNSLSRSLAALSAPIISVLGHWNVPFLATMQSELEYVRWLPPCPTMTSFIPSTMSFSCISVSDSVASLFTCSGRSCRARVAATPTIQSPRLVRLVSLVISKVVACVLSMFLWPCAVKDTRYIQLASAVNAFISAWSVFQ